VAGLLADVRELVADLSHRLRTPITALRLDVDLLAEAQERERMTGHVDELVRAVDAIVWTARHPRHESAQGRCDAPQVVRERARFWAVLAADQGRELRVAVPDAALTVGVSADELGAALDVLVDNVFSHTPDRTPFSLSVWIGTGVVDVVVEDDGPGFATPDAADRGRSGAGSTGLGLDVARRTAENANGHLVLGSSPAGGARIVLEFPVTV
jgi:signal transduction histidine kinase